MTMRVFRDLFVRGEPDRIAATIDEIDRSLTGGWFRDWQDERQLAALPGLGGKAICFGCFAEGDRPGATVILTPKGQGVLYASNVIPHSRRQLDYDQYNRVLGEFFDRFVKPAADKSGVRVELTDTEADLEKWLAPGAAEKLRKFSSCANRGTGSAHPQDRERWNEFVFSAHQEKGGLDASTLRRWLIEVDGWAPEVAEQLALEYAYGRELLAFADGLRRSA
jgi:hypothetical protein